MRNQKTLFGTVMIGIAMMIVLFIVFTAIIWLLQNFVAYKDLGVEHYLTFYDYLENIPAPQMFIIVFFGLGLIGVSAKIISLQLKKSFKNFNKEFFRALEKKELMDPSNFYFKEFSNLTTLINPLIEKIIFDEKQLQTIIDAQNSLIITRNHNKILNVNRAFLEFFNVESLESFKISHVCISDFFLSDENDYLKTKMDETHWVNYILRNPLREHKVKIHKKNKTYIFSVKAKVTTMHTMYRVVITFSDISSIEQERKNLIIDATTDPLTKVANRLKFDTLLKQQIELSKRYNYSFCTIMLDVDNFKIINDTYGHGIGDRVLETLAKILRNNVRKSDTIARWGGEEFVVILPHTKLVTGVKIAEKLRHIIADIHIENIPTFTCSFGVSEYKKDQTTEEFMHDVDTKLYEAKNSGKNCVISK